MNRRACKEEKRGKGGLPRRGTSPSLSFRVVEVVFDLLHGTKREGPCDRIAAGAGASGEEKEKRVLRYARQKTGELLL